MAATRIGLLVEGDRLGQAAVTDIALSEKSQYRGSGLMDARGGINIPRDRPGPR